MAATTTQTSSDASDARASSMTFVERFITDNYQRQPRWLRTFTFTAFVALFIYGFVTIFAGTRTVSGWVTVADGTTHRPASNFDVSYAGDVHGTDVGTSHAGFFDLPVDVLTYARVLVGGKIVLNIGRDTWTVPVTVTAAGVLSSALQEVDLPADQVKAALAVASALHDQAPRLSDAAFAAAPTASNRLFIRSIAGSSAMQGRRVTSTCRWNNKTLPLLSSLGRAAGPLPISRGTLELGNGYYFDMGTTARFTSATITLDEGGLFGASESFAVAAALGQSQSLTGSRGSVLVVAFAGSGGTMPLDAVAALRARSVRAARHAVGPVAPGGD